jgi:hypothetical protein
LKRALASLFLKLSTEATRDPGVMKRRASRGTSSFRDSKVLYEVKSGGRPTLARGHLRV